jgi:CubicO group peptidase (beta-lactamase class C family)
MAAESERRPSGPGCVSVGQVRRWTKLHSVINRSIEDGRIVGTVVLVAHRGETVYQQAAGLAERETGKPMREDSIFLLSSVTKPIVTAAAMRLVQDGALELDDPVVRYLPQFRPCLPNGLAPSITIRQLLTHTAGLSYRSFEPPDSAYHLLNVSDGLDQPGLSLKENLSRLARAPLVYEPGTAWRYSLALDVMGAVIEAVSGKSLKEAVRESITGPLGMTDTDFAVIDPSRFVTPYADGQDEPVRVEDGAVVPLFGAPLTFAPSRIFDNASYESGGAGMAGTATDVMRFFETIRIGRDSILQASSLDRMLTQHVDASAQTWGPGWGFGLGWAVLADPTLAGTPQCRGTIQWGGVYGHTWFVDRKSSLSVVALTNTAFEGMSGDFPRNVRDAVYAELRASV